MKFLPSIFTLVFLTFPAIADITGKPRFIDGDTIEISDVRLWLLADIQPHPEIRPLYPRKRTFFSTSVNVCF